MAVVKRKDMDWKEYLIELATYPGKVSDVSKAEFAGFLLRKNISESDHPADLMGDIFGDKDNHFLKLIASYLIAESPDTTFDLLNGIKQHIVNLFSESIDIMVETTRQTQIKTQEPNETQNEEI